METDSASRRDAPLTLLICCGMQNAGCLMYRRVPCSAFLSFTVPVRFGYQACFVDSRNLQFSTNALRRDSARSHCSETRFRCCLISSIGSGSSSKRLSRPARTQRTIPARSRTRRCLVIACRVSLEPSVRREIECRFPRQSFATNDTVPVAEFSNRNSTRVGGSWE